jgi:hypothetical protein
MRIRNNYSLFRVIFRFTAVSEHGGAAIPNSDGPIFEHVAGDSDLVMAV